MSNSKTSLSLAAVLVASTFGLFGMTKGGNLQASDQAGTCPVREGTTHYSNLDVCVEGNTARASKQRGELPVINNHAGQASQKLHMEHKTTAAQK